MDGSTASKGFSVISSSSLSSSISIRFLTPQDKKGLEENAAARRMEVDGRQEIAFPIPFPSHGQDKITGKPWKERERNKRSPVYLSPSTFPSSQLPGWKGNRRDRCIQQLWDRECWVVAIYSLPRLPDNV